MNIIRQHGIGRRYGTTADSGKILSEAVQVLPSHRTNEREGERRWGGSEGWKNVSPMMIQQKQVIGNFADWTSVREGFCGKAVQRSALYPLVEQKIRCDMSSQRSNLIHSTIACIEKMWFLSCIEIHVSVAQFEST